MPGNTKWVCSVSSSNSNSLATNINTRALILSLLIRGGVEQNPGPEKWQQVSSKKKAPQQADKKVINSLDPTRRLLVEKGAAVVKDGRFYLVPTRPVGADEKCFRCNKTGHYAATCRAAQKQEQPQQKPKLQQQQRQQQEPEKKGYAAALMSDRRAGQLIVDRVITLPAFSGESPQALFFAVSRYSEKVVIMGEEERERESLVNAFMTLPIFRQACPFGCGSFVFRPQMAKHIRGHLENARGYMAILEASERNTRQDALFTTFNQELQEMATTFQEKRLAILEKIALQTKRREEKKMRRAAEKSPQGAEVTPHKKPRQETPPPTPKRATKPATEAEDASPEDGLCTAVAISKLLREIGTRP